MSKAAHYAELEQRLKALIEGAVELPENARAHAKDFANNGEYGLALDTLGDWAVELDIDLSDATIDAMSALYGLMKADQRNIEYLRQRRHT